MISFDDWKHFQVNTKPIGRPIIELINTPTSPDWNAYNLQWVVDTNGGFPIIEYDVEIQQVKVDPSTCKKLVNDP